MSTSDFVKQTTNVGYGGTNRDINQRLNNTFNQWTRLNNDECAYVNDMRILRKPMKYYTAEYWAPNPTNNVGNFSEYSTFTAIGNQKTYNVSGNLTYPGIGEPTHMRNKRYLEHVMPFNTTPHLGSNTINTEDIDVVSTRLGFGIGELTNMNDLTRDVTTATDYNRWHYVDKNVVQNPNNVIFADGIIPVGGISSRNELRNYN